MSTAADKVVQVVDAAGEFSDAPEWFPEDEDLGAEVLSVVAVLGPQASGKSTLCNAALGTAFAVAPRGAVGRATTRGIAAAKAAGSPTVLALDMEGCDARARLGAAASGGGNTANNPRRAGRLFQAQCAALAASLADIIVLNLWYHDIGRLDATGYVLLETVFAEAVKATGAGEKGGGEGEPAFRSALVFAVRDVDDDVEHDQLHDILVNDARELWHQVVGPPAAASPAAAAAAAASSTTTTTTSASASPALEDYFVISTVPLPHMRHRPDQFKAACKDFGRRITDRSAEGGFLCQTEFSKGIPADSCVVFARGIWDSFSPPSALARAGHRGGDAADTVGDHRDRLLGGGAGGDHDDLDGGAAGGGAGAAGEDSLVAAYRCNEAFSEALQASSAKIADHAQVLEDGEKIDALGSKMRDVMTDALDVYDDAAAGYADEPIHARKRRELESVLETSLHSLFLKQIQLLRESALAHFKSATTSEEMPSDFAFFTADSLFSREAEESKRPGSGWSYNNERTDLQNMMQEISTQRKRLLSSQVTAAQQHANAMQYLQVQQAHMQAMQQQSFGGSAGQWNVGAAYRPPDTNINASLSYQQGRTNIQISMVPDESASLLGPNGFTAGVGPGNLGLSFNINV